jgi:hypothetical protein
MGKGGLEKTESEKKLAKCKLEVLQQISKAERGYVKEESKTNKRYEIKVKMKNIEAIRKL